MDGKDVVARDRTGSGKTLAFVLPILDRFSKSSH
jgi:superfamily II DNA/RNA helicase